MYPAETNLILSLAMTSIFVVHIYACLNTISWQLYLCCVINVVLGFYFLFYLTFSFLLFLFGCTVGGFVHRHGNLKDVFFFVGLYCKTHSVSELPTSCGHKPGISVVLSCLSFSFLSFFFFFFKPFFFCCISQSWYHSSACNHNSLIYVYWFWISK